MRWSWILPCVMGTLALACAAPVRAQSDSETEDGGREARVAEVQNSFSGPTGGIRIVDAASGPQGTFRLALNSEFFVIKDYFVPTDEAQHFAGNLSLSIAATDYLEVFLSAEATSAWDDSNDPMLIQRVADFLLGLKGFYRARPWFAVGGDASVAFLGGVGDAKATFRATSFGFRGNLTFDFREHERHEAPMILRINAQYWFDNSAKLTEGIEDQRYAALGGVVPRGEETRHLLTAFERYAYGVNRTDFVRVSTGIEAPLKARKVGLHPMLEWRWDIPIDRQGFDCAPSARARDDGCLGDEGLKAFPMELSVGLRILPPPKGLAFTIAADIGLTGTRDFVRELAPSAPYNIILGVAYAFDPRPAAAVVPGPVEPVTASSPTGQLRGRIVDGGDDSPVSGALVAVVGLDVSPQLSDAEGQFVTYGLPEGEVVLEVSHPEFETAQCTATVPSDTECWLVPSSLDGRLQVLALDRAGEPVPEVPITLRGPEEHRLVSDQSGSARVESLQPGTYTAHVDDPGFLIAVAEVDIRERQQATVQIRVVRKPSRPSVVLKNKQIALRRQISFATGSEEILPNSEPLLLEVADVLIRNPDLELVEIQGHTDNRGDYGVNMRLSQLRAESVLRWLIEHGVEPTRLTARGYGPKRPLAPNITQQNRARNRRVQFKILRRVELTAAVSR
ncbi:MAG: carboxypeptidase regulatory-like domain-containing protein [Polyangiales bacterium]